MAAAFRDYRGANDGTFVRRRRVWRRIALPWRDGRRARRGRLAWARAGSRVRRVLSFARLLVVLVVVGSAGLARAADVRFVREGVEVKRLDVSDLMQACRVQAIAIDDPNYGAHERYRACRLADVIAIGFGERPDALGSADVFIRSWDGYDKPTDAARLAEDGGWVAFGDADITGDRPRFAPLGAKKIDPGPLYVVWEKPSQRGADHPWPWQVAEFEVVDFRKKYPHVVPTGVPHDAPAWQGFELFRGECIACHAINREGGTVGPDLNVPQSIVEYRPEAQIKAYIRDPATFRYGNMPAHTDLGDADLDALVAYFRAMKDRKYDPARR